MKSEGQLKISEALAGQVVLSKQGRDAGKYAVVVKVKDENFVYIADGVTRKVSAPKLKNIKHLKLTPYVLQRVSEKLAAGAELHDADVSKGLKVFDKKEGEIG